MVEAWAEKRVVISPDPTELAESGRRAVPQPRRQARGRAAVSPTSRSPADPWAPPCSRPHPAARAAIASTGRACTSGGATSGSSRAPTTIGTRSRPVPHCSTHSTSRTTNIHAVAASDDGIDLDAAATRYAEELARFARRRRPLAVVRHLLPRRRSGRPHRVAVPRPARDPDHRPGGGRRCATPPSRRRTA